MDFIFNTITESWDVLGEMSPYILFGFLVAGLLSILISPEFVERHLGGRGVSQVMKAAIFGVPLPLCSCGVIPVAASLRKHGAGRGATASFLISTPQTGVDSIMVTFSLLGPVFAIFRPIAAFISGLIGGMLVTVFGTKSQDIPVQAPVCTDGCGTMEAGSGGKIKQIFHYGFLTLPQDIARALLIGILIAGVISAMVPDDYFLPLLGTGVGAMLVMMLLGIPVYVCATASVPIAAALIAKGLSPGAALVFLMTGPATNAAAIATVWKILGRKTAVIYLATVALTAFASGFVLDAIFQVSGSTAIQEMPWMLPGYIKHISAVALLLLLGFALVRRSIDTSKKEVVRDSTPTKNVTLHISGMKCNHCVQSVRRTLSEIPGVVSVEVDLKKGHAIVFGNDLDSAELGDAVEDLGYKIRT